MLLFMLVTYMNVNAVASIYRDEDGGQKSFLVTRALDPMQSISTAVHHAVIRVCDDIGNGIETHEHTGDFEEW